MHIFLRQASKSGPLVKENKVRRKSKGDWTKGSVAYVEEVWVGSMLLLTSIQKYWLVVISCNKSAHFHGNEMNTCATGI